MAKGREQPQDGGGQAAGILATLEESFWYRVGVKSAPAHLTRKAWLFRRVESIEFVGRNTLHRQISVDFEIPRLPRLGKHAREKGRLVPVSVFGKWPPLMDFDLVGPDGLRTSLYTRDTNKKLDFGLLIGMAKDLGCEPSAPLRELLATLVSSDEPPGRAVGVVTAMLREELEIAQGHSRVARHRQITDTVNLAAQLANSSILWVPVAGTPGSDCIIKFSYLDEREPKGSLRRRLAAFSWHDRAFIIALPHAGQYTRYHLDIRRPNAGVELLRARTIAFPAEPNAARPASEQRELSAGREGDADDVQREPAPLGSAEIVDRHAHIYHPLRTVPSHRVGLQLVIAATREGFISGCLIVSVMLATLMSFAYARLSSAAGHLEPFVVLLAAVPLVLGYLLVRSEDPLEREGILGVRAMATLSGMLPIIGALSLVFSRMAADPPTPDLSVARPLWAALTIFSWLLVVGLGWSWALACSGRPVKNKHGVSRHAHRGANIALLAGTLAAACLTSAAIVETQPYAHARRQILASYLENHQPSVVIGAALLGIGAIALSALVGGIRRVRSRTARDGEGRITAILLLGAAGVWIWGTVVATGAIIWQTITLESPNSVGTVMRLVDATMNGLLAPAAVLVVTGTAWLIRRRRELPADPHLVGFAAIASVCLIVLRAVSVLSPSAVTASAALAPVGVAVWALCAAVSLRYPLGRGTNAQATRP